MKSPLVILSLAATVLCIGVAAHRTTFQPHPPRAPRVVDTLYGVTMSVDPTEAHTPRLRFEICGPDVTQLPGTGLSIAFRFDTSIQRLIGDAGFTSLAIATHVAGEAAMASLAQDPFAPPEPWRVALVIDATAMPSRGLLTLDTLPAYDITPGLTDPARQPLQVFGARCDAIHALMPR